MEAMEKIEALLKVKRVSGQNVCLLNYSTEYGYAVLLWNSDHVRPLPHSTGSMLGAGFPA